MIYARTCGLDSKRNLDIFFFLNQPYAKNVPNELHLPEESLLTVSTLFRRSLQKFGDNCYDENSYHAIYRIRPNYRTVRLNFLKALGKLVIKYPPNKGTLGRKSNRGLHEGRI